MIATNGPIYSPTIQQNHPPLQTECDIYIKTFMEIWTLNKERSLAFQTIGEHSLHRQFNPL
jgi:hypothetical protein